jgi:hypothetical protein
MIENLYTGVQSQGAMVFVKATEGKDRKNKAHLSETERVVCIVRESALAATSDYGAASGL